LTASRTPISTAPRPPSGAFHSSGGALKYPMRTPCYFPHHPETPKFKESLPNIG
jgi:hypothetical protein